MISVTSSYIKIFISYDCIINFNHRMYAYKANVLLPLPSSLVTHKLFYNTALILLQNKALGTQNVLMQKFEFQKCIIMPGFCKLGHAYRMLCAAACLCHEHCCFIHCMLCTATCVMPWALLLLPLHTLLHILYAVYCYTGPPTRGQLRHFALGPTLLKAPGPGKDTHSHIIHTGPHTQLNTYNSVNLSGRLKDTGNLNSLLGECMALWGESNEPSIQPILG